MKKFYTVATAAMAALVAVPAYAAAPQKVTGWGDFKLYLDPGHEGRSNMGIWGYSEAEKTLDVALNIKDMLENLTDMPAENLKLCRYTQQDVKGLQERSDEANAWGADFFYSIHSDAGNTANHIVLLFGGWKKNGQLVEKTPNGGKRYGEFLEPNLSGVMRVGSRGNRYDRDFYEQGVDTHTNQYPYLSVNRESNMASLLSEGGYHTQAVQQRRNMNKEYKRLEAFAAFQAILQYRNMQLPTQNFVHGMVTNSENGQPINGATVKVADKVYVTDTYESLFSKYTKNPNLIQNGLFTFENLDPGTYTMEVSAPGFETVTKQITVKEGTGTSTPDFVTFADVELTNIAPAKVDAVSADDLNNVSTLHPLDITFSRNMDKASVEKAFSIDNDGKVALSWVNDYTLRVDISKLDALWTYNIKIDGSVARNAQTNQLFDGDGDGQPGGDYVLTLTIAEADVTAPQVVSTYPAANSEVVYTHRPPVRVEYDEVIDWNDDKGVDAITLKDAAGNNVSGTVSHTVIAGKSVLHFTADADLPADKAYLVTVKAGLKDMWGNATPEYNFRFLSEYRACTDSKQLIPCTGLDSFWNPGGSGSTTGIDKDNSTTGVLNSAPNWQTKTSTLMNYVFDPGTTEAGWFIRLYNPTYTKNYSTDYKVVLTWFVYGDGSNNTTSMMVRVPNSGGGLKAKADGKVLNYRGWEPMYWDLLNDQYTHFTGTQNLDGTGNWRFDSFTLTHQDTDPDDETTPFQAWEGQVAFNSLEITKWDSSATRTAKLDDVQLPDGVENIAADSTDAPAQYYNLNGVRVDMRHAAPGLYIKRQGTTATKVTRQ